MGVKTKVVFRKTILSDGEIVMIYLLLGAGLWYMGRRTSGIPNDSDVEIVRRIAGGYVVLPQLIYWLCGVPHNEALPEKVVTTRSLIGQLIGVLFFIYGCFELNRPLNTYSPESFILIMLLGASLGYILKKIKTYNP